MQYGRFLGEKNGKIKILYYYMRMYVYSLIAYTSIRYTYTYAYTYAYTYNIYRNKIDRYIYRILIIINNQ